jgi:hypothetical protein
VSRWFRFYPETLRNPKVLSLSDKEFRLWVRLLCVAAENDGFLGPLDELKLVLSTRLDHLSTGVERLISAGLIDPLTHGYKPHSWDKFQYKSDTSTERVKKHRAKRSVSETAPDTETDTEEAEANASGTVVPFAPVDLKAEVFRSAVALLERTGTPERKGRPMIGRWLKDYGEAEVLAVLTDATARAIAAPIPWITKSLETRYGRKRTGDPILAALRAAEAECAAADQADYPGAGASLPPGIAGSA